MSRIWNGVFGSRVWCIVIVFGLFLSVVSCSKPNDTGDGVELSSVGDILEGDAEQLNCLFIVLDTTAAKHVGALGYGRPTTPNIDTLGKRGVIFERAYSQAPQTLPSTWSYLTGQYPVQERSKALGWLRVRDIDFTLAQAFQSAGFKTFGYSENPYINEEMGFTQGFDQFKSYPWLDPNWHKGEQLTYRLQSSTISMFEDATKGIMETTDAPWFSYMHILRPHEPYFAPAPWGTSFMDAEEATTASDALERGIWHGLRKLGHVPTAYTIEFLKDSYDGNLLYVDYLVGQLLTYLYQSGTLENTVVIVASDHGEEFMEHGKLGHGYRLYEELLHVPLIVYLPESLGMKPGRVEELVELVDIFPTLLEIFDLETPKPLVGDSLLSVLRAEPFTQKKVIFAQTLSTDKISVRIGGEKLICSVDLETRALSEFEIYDKVIDDGELNNLYTPGYPIEHFLVVVQEHIDRLESVPLVEGSGVSDELKETLEALGYLSE